MVQVKAIILAAIVLLISNANCIAKDIIIYGNENKPPKYFLEDAQAKGILIDIMKYVDAKLPSNFKYELYPWKRAYHYAQNHKGGIIGFSLSRERLQNFDYSDVMYYETINLIVLKGKEFDFQRISDLKGKKIGVQRGSSYGDEFEQSKSIVTYDDDGSGEQRLLKLLSGRIDAALLGPGRKGLNDTIKQNSLLVKNKDKFVIISKPFILDPNYLAFSKKLQKQAFLIEFNKILAKAHKSGEIQKIIDKHSK